MRRETFAQAAGGRGASALNRVFERYLVPVTFSSEQLHLHITYNDVDASASPLWYDDGGNVLAAALLAIRGKRGWIGGFGVAPEYRGQGYASQLLDAILQTARDRGLESVQLEVITDNTPAIGTYRKGGFHIVRTLHSYERGLPHAHRPTGFVTGSVEDFIDLPELLAPCWQRERATLRNGAVTSAAADNRGNYALFRYNAQVAQLLKLAAADAAALEAIAQTIAAGRLSQSVMLLNEPENSPICEYAVAGGWTQRLVQYEMRLAL